MGVQVKRTYTITKDGQTHVFSSDEMQAATPDTNITIICAGPKCAQRAGKDSPATLTWNEEAIQKDASAIPDDFFRLLKLTIDPGSPKEFSFCGQQCCRDFLTYVYVPSKSPREQMPEQAEKLAELNPHLVQNRTNESPVAYKVDHATIKKAIDRDGPWSEDQKLVVQMPAVGVAALCQADTVPDATGFSE